MIRKISIAMTFALLPLIGATVDLGDIGQEVRAGDIRMPVNDTGSIEVKICDVCSSHTFRTSSNTTYEIGDELVRREVLRAELLRRPKQVMLLQLTTDRKGVARLRISPAAQ